MMYVISKEFTFSAAHRLDGLPDDHQCSRMHGHNYTVRVEVGSRYLDDVGFVMDYAELKSVGQYLKDTFDHRVLNDCMEENPTAEHLAAHIRGIALMFWPSFDVAVGVSETPLTWAWVR